MEIEDLQRAARFVHGSRVPICLLYLFGPRARATAGPLCDYDFGVLLDSTYDAVELRAQLAHDLANAMDVPQIDLVRLNDAPIELA